MSNSRRFDIVQGKERNGSTYWNKLGTAWVDAPEGVEIKNIALNFDALPVAGMNKNGEVETRAVCFEAKPRGEQQQKPAERRNIYDDDIPF